MSYENIYSGEVIWFNIKRGYGFISWECDGQKQEDMFCHYSDISMKGFRALESGQKVTFYVGTNNHGDPKAINVTIIE